MQILGRKSRILLIAVAIAMLAALGFSFALWDIAPAKAANGDLSQYANAKVGDVITFGEYYQTGNKDENDPTEYEKTPIEWLVVDKDERSGQLTLMSKYILAAGSYFANNYANSMDKFGWHYDLDKTELSNVVFNQAYVDSTARAFLNNLERLDMGGDAFDATKGYLPSNRNSSVTEGLLSSVGFSNQRYWTGLSFNDAAKDLPGFVKREGSSDLYYQRPIQNNEYKNRPATRGFFNDAFSYDEKSMIVPKTIAGYIGHRWPDKPNDVATKSYVEGAYDKVWLPSATELNIMKGIYLSGLKEDLWSVPSDAAGSTVFEYFKNYSQYKNPITNTQNASMNDAVKSVRTPFVKDDTFAMNYSIPVYNKRNSNETSLTINTDISKSDNSSDFYWTRTAMSSWFAYTIGVSSLGEFNMFDTASSNIGIRPCVILQY